MEFSEFILTPKVEGATLETKSGSVPVTACLTGHHLILYSHDGKNDELWILHKNVDSVEKRFSTDRTTLVLKCKDLTDHHICMPFAEDANNVSESIQALSELKRVSALYPFFYKPKFTYHEDGYDLFCPETQISSVLEKSDQWRLSSINLHFGTCPTYPSQLIVPKAVDDEIIRRSAQFRQGGRFPILSYLHTNGRVIMRCGQPMTGQNQRRCKEDEKLVNTVLGSSHRGYILDTRSPQVALQARSKGGGCETEFNYPQWRKFHNNLQKFTVYHDSFVRIVEACQDLSATGEKWHNKFEGSGWMSHVKDVLSAACLVAQCVDREGASVLVHGSEGLDSTLLVTSLAQVVLNPECRTLRGFLSLIDSEWIQAGYPFADRCFHLVYSDGKSKSEAPSFLLFLDCVHQLHIQFPLSFEFTTCLLLELHKHTYASNFGTFLCNSEMERRQHKVRTRTVSLWSYILSETCLPQFLNPFYQKREEAIWPSVASQSLVLWDTLFLSAIIPTEEVEKVVHDSFLYMEGLQHQITSLTNEINLLESSSISNGRVLQNDI